MSKPAISLAPAPAAAEEIPTVKLPAPPRGFQYVLVPEDLRKSAVTSGAVEALCRISGGDFIAEISDDLRNLVSECMKLGKKGSLAITLAVAPDSYKKLAIKPKVKLNVPKVETELSVLFATPGGQLLTRDPDQEELDLKIVDIGRPQPRQVL